jgi:hypothetical protein
VASILKISYVHYVDRSGKRVPKGTKGARKVTTESSKYYACWREGKKQVRVPLATDYEVSQVILADLIRQRERGEARMIDPYKEHLDRPLLEHVNDYLAVVRSTTRSESHHKETGRILNLFVKNAGCARLRDVTADRVTSYLSQLTSGPTTRNMHRRILVMFMNHMEERGRIERNPLTRKSVKPAKKGEERHRRALKADDVGQRRNPAPNLDAGRRGPLDVRAAPEEADLGSEA